MNAPFVHQLRTGKVKKMGIPKAKKWGDRYWESGIYKKPVQNELWLGKSGLTGDAQGDTKNHGGPEKAVFAYPMKHYEYWREDLDLDATVMDTGMMGENLAVSNADEHSVCIGDTYAFGDAIIQVSQPRRPCWRPARRIQKKDFSLRIQNSGLTGWYYRVLKVGYVQDGVELELRDRPHPEWTIAACNDVMYKQKNNVQLAEELASCQYLSDNWKRTLNKRIAGNESDPEKRLYGPNQ